MNKGQLWKIFMKTGKVSDYLNYKNAEDHDYPLEDNSEMSEELAQEFAKTLGEDVADDDEEYYDVNQNGRFSDS